MSVIDDHPRWRRWLLLGGIVGGLALASLSALTGGAPSQTAMPPGAVARVGDVMILRADLVRAVNAVSAGRRNVLNDTDKAAILQRLIEEELLIQRALDMGLAHEDTALRNALVSAVTKDIIARSRAKPISPVRLRDYYFKNKMRFSRPARAHVRAVFIPRTEAKDRMAAFDASLSGGAAAQDLVTAFGQNTPPLPDGLLPLQKLKDYIGPAPLTALETLKTGQWSDWIEDNDGLWRLYLVNRTRARTPELSSVRDQVEAAYRDERDDAQLRAYIERLKRGAAIELSADAPQ